MNVCAKEIGILFYAILCKNESFYAHLYLVIDDMTTKDNLRFEQKKYFISGKNEVLVELLLRGLQGCCGLCRGCYSIPKPPSGAAHGHAEVI